MSWLSAVLYLYFPDFCFKHREQREGIMGYSWCATCSEEEFENKVTRRAKNTAAAKKRLGWTK